MFSSDIINDIRFGLEIITIVFVVYLYFRKPQIAADTDIKTHYQRLTSFIEKVDMMFCQVNKDIINLKDNHIHTLETKIDQIQGKLSALENGQTKLFTIMEERLPRK